MSTNVKRFLAVGLALAFGVALHFSCAGGGGGTIVESQFTIGGKTFTFKLGVTGVIAARAGDPPQQKAGIVSPLFDQTPTDTPQTAAITLPTSNVTVIPLAPAKFQSAAQPVTGSGELSIYIDSASSTDPCNQGVLIGTFGLTFTGGVVTIDRASLDVPPAAMDFVLSGTFTICLELTTTVDVELTVPDMGVEYGPSGAPPSDNVNENISDVGTTGAPGFTLTVDLQGQGTVELAPPGGTYEQGTEVTVTVTPDAGWVFVNWAGDLAGTHNPDTITITGDTTITAVLLQPEQIFEDATDFEQGTLIGLGFDEQAGGLTLSGESDTLPFIWVPNSNEGTISKVDTDTGNELGRYRVCPAEVYGNPSRTTVDLAGSCYVGNRATGTVVKVGLFENGGYVDRNGNGTIETSSDLNGDGDITGEELLTWGQDECVLWEAVLAIEGEGTYVPGTFTGTYPNDDWNPGTRSIAVDASNNVWVGAYGTRKFWYLNGTTGDILRTVDVSSVSHTPYGAVLDRNGILWSSGQSGYHVLRLDPSDDSFTTIAPGHFVYGLGADRENHLFISGWSDTRLTRLNVVTGEVDWSVPGVYESRGVAVTDDGDVWVANSSPGTVTRWSNDGVIKATISVGNTPTGVAVDANGKVWAVNFGDAYIKRIDPATDAVDLEKAILGTVHYGYSDMTGIVARSVSTQIGNWTVDYGSAEAQQVWDTVAWGSLEPQGTSISVRVRSSDDQITWSDWFEVTSGTDLAQVPPGRYLQIEATLQILSGDLSPILSYLAVFTQD
ncbi:MAG TPA: hypothetical protein VM243_06990 [Phycisphaerae bacterium]|nr:hypothetical protein [Phycisphaerae bacterium]